MKGSGQALRFSLQSSLFSSLCVLCALCGFSLFVFAPFAPWRFISSSPQSQAPSPKPQASSLKPQEYRAPGERQTLSVSVYSHRMKKPATYRSNPSSRASLPRVVQRSGVAIRRCEASQGPWQSHFAFCTVTHSARQKTKHHLNSALVGGSLEKKEFCRGFVEFCAARSPSGTFCVVAHCTRRQTLHHPNNALVGRKLQNAEFWWGFV